MDLRLAAADTVILDTPRLVCLWRVVKRRLRFHNRTRPDMTVGNPERLTEEFLRFVWRYPKQKPDLLEQLGRLEHAHVVHLRTSRGRKALSRGGSPNHRLTTLYRLIYYRSV